MTTYEVKAMITKEHWQGFFVGVGVAVVIVIILAVIF